MTRNITDKKEGKKMKSIPEKSIDTIIIYERLLELKPGEVVDYEELTELIGRDIRGFAYNNLMLARAKALDENNYVFEAVKNVGIKRIDDVGLIDGIESGRKAIFNRAKKEARKLVCIKDFDSLTSGQKIKHNAALSMFGAVSQFSTLDNYNIIQKNVNNSSSSGLDFNMTIKLFSEG